jgi:hypothetical protein
MLGGALAKKKAAAAPEEDSGSGRPDMASMLGGALAKKKVAAAGGGLPAPPPGGKGMGGMLAGIGGGLGGLKKAGGATGRNSASGLIKQLQKEKVKAEQELSAFRSRGVSAPQAAVLVDALNQVLEKFKEAEAMHKIFEAANEAKKPFDLAHKEEHAARKAAKTATLHAVDCATKANTAAQAAYDLKVAETEMDEKELSGLRAAARSEGKLTEAETAEATAAKLKAASLSAKAEAEEAQQEHEKKQNAVVALGPPPPSSELPPKPDPSAVGFAAKNAAAALLTAEQHAVKSGGECQKKMDELQTSLEKWAKRKLEAPERDAQEAEREKEWASANSSANDEALRELRKFMPPSLPKVMMILPSVGSCLPLSLLPCSVVQITLKTIMLSLLLPTSTSSTQSPSFNQ